MKNPFLPCVLAAAAVGGGVAFLVDAFSPRPIPQSRAETGDPAGETGTGSIDALLARIDVLQRTNEELMLRMAALESRPASVAPARTPVAEAPVEVLPADERALRELIANFSPQGNVTDAFIDRVGQAMSVIEEEQQRQRDEERRLEREARLEDRLSELRVDLGLSQYQVDEMRTVLSTSEAKRSEMWAGARDGAGDREGMREAMREIRDASDAALKKILDPDQYARYQESQGDRGGFGGRDFGGGFGGGGRGDAPPGDGTGGRRRGNSN